MSATIQAAPKAASALLAILCLPRNLLREALLGPEAKCAAPARHRANEAKSRLRCTAPSDNDRSAPKAPCDRELNNAKARATRAKATRPRDRRAPASTSPAARECLRPESRAGDSLHRNRRHTTPPDRLRVP